MFYLGLDLGQRRDYSALVVVERRDMYPGFQNPKLHSMAVRHAERMPLNTQYVDVVTRVKAVVQDSQLRGNCCLTVDATGVGAPVVELLKGARLGCDVAAVTITGGERANCHSEGWNVPKQDLVAGVQVLLERRYLKIAKEMKTLKMLMRELMDMQAQGATGYGQHDDLVMALALALWRARKNRDQYWMKSPFI